MSSDQIVSTKGHLDDAEILTYKAKQLKQYIISNGGDPSKLVNKTELQWTALDIKPWNRERLQSLDSKFRPMLLDKVPSITSHQREMFLSSNDTKEREAIIDEILSLLPSTDHVTVVENNKNEAMERALVVNNNKTEDSNEDMSSVSTHDSMPSLMSDDESDDDDDDDSDTDVSDHQELIPFDEEEKSVKSIKNATKRNVSTKKTKGGNDGFLKGLQGAFLNKDKKGKKKENKKKNTKETKGKNENKQKKESKTQHKNTDKTAIKLEKKTKENKTERKHDAKKQKEKEKEEEEPDLSKHVGYHYQPNDIPFFNNSNGNMFLCINPRKLQADLSNLTHANVFVALKGRLKKKGKNKKCYRAIIVNLMEYTHVDKEAQREILKRPFENVVSINAKRNHSILNICKDKEERLTLHEAFLEYKENGAYVNVDFREKQELKKAKEAEKKRKEVIRKEKEAERKKEEEQQRKLEEEKRKKEEEKRKKEEEKRKKEEEKRRKEQLRKEEEKRIEEDKRRKEQLRKEETKRIEEEKRKKEEEKQRKEEDKQRREEAKKIKESAKSLKHSEILGERVNVEQQKAQGQMVDIEAKLAALTFVNKSETNENKDNGKDEYVTTELMNLCRLYKSDIDLLINDKSMEEVTKGLYIRAPISAHAPGYRVYEIQKTMHKPPHHYFNVCYGSKSFTINTTKVSNDAFTEKEVNEWRERMRKNGVLFPTQQVLIDECVERLKDLRESLVYKKPTQEDPEPGMPPLSPPQPQPQTQPRASGLNNMGMHQISSSFQNASHHGSHGNYAALNSRNLARLEQPSNRDRFLKQYNYAITIGANCFWCIPTAEGDSQYVAFLLMKTSKNNDNLDIARQKAESVRNDVAIAEIREWTVRSGTKNGLWKGKGFIMDCKDPKSAYNVMLELQEFLPLTFGHDRPTNFCRPVLSSFGQSYMRPRPKPSKTMKNKPQGPKFNYKDGEPSIVSMTENAQQVTFVPGEADHSMMSDDVQSITSLSSLTSVATAMTNKTVSKYDEYSHMVFPQKPQAFQLGERVLFHNQEYEVVWQGNDGKLRLENEDDSEIVHAHDVQHMYIE